MPELDSSSLQTVEYDSEREALQVTFRHTGRTYEYLAVPQTVYDDLLAAPSSGTWFNKHVRDNYQFREIIRR